jgi:hypothetical protein
LENALRRRLHNGYRENQQHKSRHEKPLNRNAWVLSAPAATTRFCLLVCGFREPSRSETRGGRVTLFRLVRAATLGRGAFAEELTSELDLESRGHAAAHMVPKRAGRELTQHLVCPWAAEEVSALLPRQHGLQPDGGPQPSRAPPALVTDSNRRAPRRRSRALRIGFMLGSLFLAVHLLLPLVGGLEATAEALARSTSWLPWVLVALEAVSFWAYGELLLAVVRGRGAPAAQPHPALQRAVPKRTLRGRLSRRVAGSSPARGDEKARNRSRERRPVRE